MLNAPIVNGSSSANTSTGNAAALVPTDLTRGRAVELVMSTQPDIVVLDSNATDNLHVCWHYERLRAN